ARDHDSGLTATAGIQESPPLCGGLFSFDIERCGAQLPGYESVPTWDSTEGPMAIWSTLKGELDKAGRAAQGALDEGKLRLEQHRAKQRAEAAAASLGFAVYRARAAGGELEAER